MKHLIFVIVALVVAASIALAISCPKCSHDAKGTAKFCSQCGTRLVAKSSMLVNTDFDKDLTGWRVFHACSDAAGAKYRAGTIDWNAKYGGCAKVVVSGAPSTISIQQEFREFIPKGSRITFEVSKPADNRSGWYAFAGGMNVKLLLSTDQTKGKDSISIVTDQDYFRGTPLLLHFTVWPGTSTFYVKSVKITKP